MHWAPDIDCYEALIMVFRNKMATDKMRWQNSKWMEDDISG